MMLIRLEKAHHASRIHETLFNAPLSTEVNEIKSVASHFDHSYGSLLHSVDVFDGREVFDPVVVSNVFWTSLKAKLLSVVFGQLLAAVTFAILSTFVSSWLANLTDGFRDNNTNDIYKQTSTSRPRFESNSNSKLKPQVAPDFSKLALCLLIDFGGDLSELLPVLGEFTDLVYAPFAAAVLRSLYKRNNVLFAVEFIEELLPFTDVLPFATICWFIDTFLDQSAVARLLRLGIYTPSFVETQDNKDSSASSNATKIGRDE
jgi:hypothetical protein